MKPQRKNWCDERIEEGIREVMAVYGLHRMPTSTEVSVHTGDGALRSAISRSGGFTEWAQRLGLKEKKQFEPLNSMVREMVPICDREWSDTADMMLVADMKMGKTIIQYADAFRRTIKSCERRLDELKRSGEYARYDAILDMHKRISKDEYAIGARYASRYAE